MQAILTRHLSQTNKLPARIAVSTQAGRLVFSRDMFDVSAGAASVEHQAALLYVWRRGLYWLCDGAELVSGSLPNGDGCHVIRTGTWRDRA
jgi:hypothetical protein